ncbi:hypothetical protein [Calycomorphotria hydatis]|nr:hypothetical protein [Calycomorphotria hydatis]
MNHSQMPEPVENPAYTEPPLVTPTTILVLSGFLFGMLAGDLLPPSDHMLLFAAAAAGVVSYAGLAYAAHRRRLARIHSYEQELAERLEHRMERYTPPVSKVPRTTIEEQLELLEKEVNSANKVAEQQPTAL